MFYGVHPPAMRTSSQCEALCCGSAAASAELSAALKAVTWHAGEFDGVLEHTAGSLQETPALWPDREAGLALLISRR